VITQIYAYTGALLPAGTSSNKGDSALCRLSQNSLLRLVIPVPERAVSNIQIGEPVAVNVSGMDRTFEGKIIRFSDQIDTNTRTMHTEVDVPNPERVLMPGLYAEAELGLDQKDDVPTVPLQALTHQGNRTTVLVVNSRGEVEDRTVQVGLQTTSDAEIVSGLHPGEQVVVTDRSGVKPGQKVHPQAVAVMEYQDPNALAK
jgi:RND family efflux transporter MFP subunit